MPLSPQEIESIIAGMRPVLEAVNNKPLPSPKFKVGDRVKIRVTNQIGNITGSCPESGAIYYEVSGSPFPYRVNEVELELAPWTLPAPPEGREWHRLDWTQDMLPDGWRPLLMGERPIVGKGNDEYWVGGETGFHWQHYGSSWPLNNWERWRTRRPLPDPERERFEKWARGYYEVSFIGWDNGIKQYEPPQVHGAWLAWTAARKSSHP